MSRSWGMVTASLVLCVGCSNVPRDVVGFGGTVTGRVVKGPVSGATVTLVRLNDEQGLTIAPTETDDVGAFQIRVGNLDGDFLVCAVGGSYTEEATGTLVTLSPAQKMCTIVTGFSAGETRADVSVTPWTQLAYARASHLSKSGTTLVDAWHQSVAEWESFFGCSAGTASPSRSHAAGLLRAIPADPTTEAEAVVGLTPSRLSGILLGGLSHQAKLMSEHLNMTPGIRLTAAGLVEALSRDVVVDGKLDGRAGEETLQVEGYPLDAGALRGSSHGLVQGVRRFLEGDRNKTSVQLDDLRDRLRCIAAAEGPLFGAETGPVLDMDGPELLFESPQVNSVVSGAFNALVTANDPSLVRYLAFTETQEKLIADQLSLDGANARLTGVFDSSALPEGPFTVRAYGEDAVGNRSDGRLKVVVNNRAPVIEVSTPRVGETVVGAVRIAANASDSYGIESLSAVWPTDLEDVDPAQDVLVVDWDSTTSTEGSAVVRLVAVDKHGQRSEKEVPVVVDNLVPQTLEGWAALETPIRNAQVAAYAFENGVLGERLGHGVVDGGQYRLQVADTYSGPIAVQVFGAQASYQDAATGATVSFEPGDILTTIYDYRPKAADAHIEGVAVNAWTTLATWYAQALSGQGTPFKTAMERAFFLVGAHLLRPDGDLTVETVLALATTHPADFSGSVDDAPEHELLLGMAHVGLSCLGSQAAADGHLPNTSRPTIHLLRLLKQDLEDGVLDGHGASVATIPVTADLHLNTDTLRSNLATAVMRCLASAPSSGLSTLSTVSLPTLAQPGGFLDDLTSDTSELFGAEEPARLDREGPVVTTNLPGMGLVRGTVSFDVWATDLSGVQSVEILQPSSSATALRTVHAYASSTNAELNTRVLADGPADLVIVARDEVGNETRQVVHLTVDNTAPTLRLGDIPTFVKTPAVTISAVSDDANGVAVLTAKVQGAVAGRLENPNGDASFAMRWARCDAASIEVSAEDRAGNVTRSTFSVVCDDELPEITLTGAEEAPAHENLTINLVAGEFSYLDPGRIRRDYNNPDSWGPALPLHLAQLSNQSPHVPKIIFRTGDANGVTSVAYRYLKRGAVAMSGMWGGPRAEPRKVYRDWTNLGAGRGDWTIHVSLEDLHEELLKTNVLEDHTIEIRAVDAAGNTRVLYIPFRVQLLSPPAVLSDCEVASEMNSFNLDEHTMPQFYTPGSKPVAACNLRLDTPFTRAVSETEYVMDVIANPIFSHVSELIEKKDHNQWGGGGWGGTSCETTRVPESCYGLKHQFPSERPHWDPICARSGIKYYEPDTECFDGEYPDAAAYDFAWSDSTAPSAGSDHAATIRVFWGEQEVAREPGGFKLKPNRTYRIIRYVEAPELRINGERYEWELGWTAGLLPGLEYILDKFHVRDLRGASARNLPVIRRHQVRRVLTEHQVVALPMDLSVRVFGVDAQLFREGAQTAVYTTRLGRVE